MRCAPPQCPPPGPTCSQAQGRPLGSPLSRPRVPNANYHSTGRLKKLRNLTDLCAKWKLPPTRTPGNHQPKASKKLRLTGLGTKSNGHGSYGNLDSLDPRGSGQPFGCPNVSSVSPKCQRPVVKRCLLSSLFASLFFAPSHELPQSKSLALLLRKSGDYISPC